MKDSKVLHRQIQMPMYMLPRKFTDEIRLFSKLKEEQLEYPTDLLATRKDAFLRHLATIRGSNQFSNN